MWWKIGALSGMSAVLLGAFGAHALRAKPWISPRDLEVWETACKYQFYHAFAILMSVNRGNIIAARIFFSGMLIFSGSLYLMILLGEKRLGILTPIGGLGLAAGWASLAFM